MKSIALLWNRGMRPLSIIAWLVLEHKGKSRSSALTGNSDWTGSWGDLGGVWHLALPFDEYFRKFWYPHLQWFQRSTDNCGKIHVGIILGHPICMFFKDISRSRALIESKVAPCCSPVNSTLHRHIIRVRFLTSARHVKIEKRLLPWRCLQENACEL